MTLVPAYGRDYTSKKAVEADLNAGKDFVISDFTSPWDGKPVGKEELRKIGETTVNVRYGKLRKVCVIKL